MYVPLFVASHLNFEKKSKKRPALLINAQQVTHTHIQHYVVKLQFCSGVL